MIAVAEAYSKMNPKPKAFDDISWLLRVKNTDFTAQNIGQRIRLGKSKKVAANLEFRWNRHRSLWSR